MNSINLISENYIKTHSAMMQNVDSQLIVAHISEAQNIDYRHLIGKDLFNRIITEFTEYKDYVDGGGTNPINTIVSQAIVDLVDESQSYLMYRVLTNSNYSLSTHMTNKGTTQQNSENTTNADASMLGKMELKYASRANSVGVQLLEFIDDNIADYPEYSTTDCDSSTVGTIGIYLGNEI